MGDQRTGSQQRKRQQRRTCLTCCGVCTILLILIVVILVILAFTVFKPKQPKMRVDNITLEDFQADVVLNIPPSIKLNVTLGLVVSVTNPNKVGFKYYNSTTHMFYRDVEVGLVPIPSGQLDAGQTKQISTSIELLADRLITDSRLYKDFFAGSIPLSTTSEISGKVNILNIIKRHIDTSSVCNFTIAVGNTSTAIDNMVCSYDIDI
eukprot:c4387_g1_i1 orf=454-1074(-)